VYDLICVLDREFARQAWSYPGWYGGNQYAGGSLWYEDLDV